MISSLTIQNGSQYKHKHVVLLWKGMRTTFPIWQFAWKPEIFPEQQIFAPILVESLAL